MIRVYVILVFVLALPVMALAETSAPLDVLVVYLGDALAGDWEAAANWWLPEDLDRSTRLGITYRDIPFKLDCASYLMVPAVKKGGTPIIGEPVGDEEAGPLRYRVTFPVGSESVSSDYIVIRDEDRWVLAAPTTALGRAWPITESKYLRFHVQPGQNLNPSATQYLDEFVAWCGARLGLPDDQMDHLRNAKLDYFLCAEDVVEAIAGAPTRGVSMLPVDAVVTSEPAHTHELAHLLMGYAAQDLGMYVLPSLQEGIAVHLGGRWGRSRQVQEEMGRYVLQSGFADVGTFLSWQDFRNELPDLVYAPAGILTGYLLDELGPEGFLELYRDYSGWSNEVASSNSEQIAADLESRLGLESGTLGESLGKYAMGLVGGGIEPGEGPPGGPTLILENENLKAIITTSDEWVTFDIIAESGEPVGVLFLGPTSGPIQASRLFADRFPDREYQGERGAVLFHGRETGFYDFSIDVLTAKYVYDFRPDPAFLTGQGLRVKFRILRSLLPEDLASWIIESKDG